MKQPVSSFDLRGIVSFSHFFQLLDEMLDNGFPLATETNILQELIKPPTILRTVVNMATGGSKYGTSSSSNVKLFNCVMKLCFSVSTELPSGQLSNIPWRRAGVKYTNNEAYFDVIEEVDAILDKSGTVVTAEIQGCVRTIVSHIAWSKIKIKLAILD